MNGVDDKKEKNQLWAKSVVTRKDVEKYLKNMIGEIKWLKK